MALINLLDKFHDQLVEAYGRDSYTANLASKEYSFNGVKSIELLTMLPTPLSHGYMSNGTPRTGGNRLGTPGEVTDAMQVLELMRDSFWTNTIDAADNSQQGYLKRAGEYMRIQMRQMMNPDRDKWNIYKWAMNAGKVVAASAALSKSNIVEELCKVEEYFGDQGIPEDDRYVLLPIKHWTYLRLADEFIGTNGGGSLASNILKGWRGDFASLHLIFVPNDYMPSNVYFVAFQKNSVISPSTFKHIHIYENAPGYVGPLMEYLEYYDAFVIGALNAGVYALVASGYKTGTPTFGTVAGSGASTYCPLTGGTSGATAYYTLDGTDPKWSKTAKTTTYNGNVVIGASFTGTLRVVERIETAGSEKYWSEEGKQHFTASVKD